ncbi:unnamed protein product [Menidia menidia]|uniref:(Atlantic silverside) hypothetical protein n=1 Tax=Menidia menidia TaxID=238744 RepID=A0A8S4BQ73_9TELE|nr:unnamed protein product [Menidia menidia]
MPPVKTVYVPRFGSQLGSSQRTEPELELVEPSPVSQNENRLKKRSKNGSERNIRSVLKIKLPKFTSTPLLKVTKDGTTPAKYVLRPSTSKPKTTGNQERRTQCADPVSTLVNGDVFSFSQRSETTTPKEKAQLSVVRTISKMLEENRLIRQRLAALRQDSRV